MLTVKDIMKELKVSRRTVYNWIKSGELKALKVRGIVRIEETEYERFIRGGK